MFPYMDSKTQTKVDKWTITQDGPDFQGKNIFMVRYNGKPYTRAYSMSEARHLLRRYKPKGR